MSRAFVRESDYPSLPELPTRVSALPPGVKNLLTARGAERLRDELACRQEERAALAAKPIEDADARRELALLDQRIHGLQESLRTAETPPLPPPPHDVVRFGATVTVRETNGGTTRYRIVGVDETEADPEAVSWLSPLARALLNARLGERVTFRAPRGLRELEIVAIDYE